MSPATTASACVFAQRELRGLLHAMAATSTSKSAASIILREAVLLDVDVTSYNEVASALETWAAELRAAESPPVFRARSVTPPGGGASW